MNKQKQPFLLSVTLLAAVLVFFLAACRSKEFVTYAQNGNSNSAPKWSSSLGNAANFEVPAGVPLSMNESPGCEVDLKDSPPKKPAKFQAFAGMKITIDERSRLALNDWFTIIAGTGLKPFARGRPTDSELIHFALSRIFDLGLYGSDLQEPRPHKSDAKKCRSSKVRTIESDCSQSGSASEVNEVVMKYFGTRIKHHGITESPFTFENGCYFRWVECSDGEMGFSFSVVKSVKRRPNNIYTAYITRYDGMYSNFAECRQDCSVRIQQKIKDAAHIGDFETVMRLCPEWGATPVSKAEASFAIRQNKTNKIQRPVLHRYRLVSSS